MQERHEQSVNRLYGFAKLELKVIGKSSKSKGHPKKISLFKEGSGNNEKNEILITEANYTED